MTWLVGAYGPDMDGTGTGIVALAATADGTLEHLGVVVEAESPSFLVANGDRIYSALEGSGRVASFARAQAFELEADATADSGGKWPCHVTVAGSMLLVANYFDGSFGVVGLSGSGSVTQLITTVQDAGSGPGKGQDGPHAHATLVIDDTTVLGLDLGADRVFIHTVTGGRLERNGEFALPPGTGPRDVARHPSGLIFVLGELDGSLHVLEWSGRELLLVASAAVPGHVDGDHGAAIGFSADGLFVYTGLRGSHRIGVLSVSADGRELAPVGWIPSGGAWPRHLAVDGQLLHVANERSNSVDTFRLGNDGLPQPLGSVEVASPTYLLKIAD
ncbi:MAG: beta-propeller fold lactonase family protein [Rhodoglobus sp.]